MQTPLALTDDVPRRTPPTRLGERVRSYFEKPPSFEAAFAPALILAALLFVRSPASNFVFDEQEALLANPYVNGKTPFFSAFQRDFWGLGAERSIGSYRPLPNVIWRILWWVREVSWLPHWVNVVVHAVNAALVTTIAWKYTGERRTAWLSGAVFVTFAVLTEAVSGVVGLADVLGAFGVLLAVAALGLCLWQMTFVVFVAGLVGLFSKESAMVATVLVPLAAWVSAPLVHPARPRRLLRTSFAALASSAAFVAYTEARRRWFPVSSSAEAPAFTGSSFERALSGFLAWFEQPRLPQDPLNNPLVDADFPHRLAGALRVYFRGLTQAIFPRTLSGDYSYAQEPVPERLIFPESVLGALAFLLPLAVGIGFLVWIHLSSRRGSKDARLLQSLLALGLLWWPLAYFPHSNIAVLLPTVRAERFWYIPAIGLAWVLGVLFAKLLAHSSGSRRVRWARGVVVGFFAVQAGQARWHALDYTDDLIFWRSTAKSSPSSAKGHLNYSVMVGARGDLEGRLVSSKRALEIAPSWPMANVYYADTLCRLRRPGEAWPHYRKGFELGPNETNLIALGLQCLWEEGAVLGLEPDIQELVDQHPGSWLAFLGREILENGEKHQGLEEKYRPRAYNAGPKE